MASSSRKENLFSGEIKLFLVPFWSVAYKKKERFNSCIDILDRWIDR